MDFENINQIKEYNKIIEEKIFESQNLSIFGNIDYFLNEQYKLAFGMRWENWDSKYNDSNNESFNPSNYMNGGKLSLIKNMNTKS